MTNNENLLKWAGAASNWALVESAIKADIARILLWGPSGTGKTSIAQSMGRNRYNVTFSEDLTVQEMIGHYIPKGNVFTWHDGPITRAMREGAVLILNELGRASGPMLDMLLGILDDPEMAELTLPTGEIVRPAKTFRAIATSNSSPHTLDPAMLDRFDVVIYIGTPNPEVIARLNKQQPKLGDVVLNSYSDPDRAISPRRMLSYAKLRAAGIESRHAALMTLGDRAQDVIVSAQSIGAAV